MFYDVLALAAVRDELRQKILGGRVQRVVYLSEHTLGCEIYANQERRWLLASAHPQNARVHLVPEKLARGTEQVTPLLLLLRKYVRGARLAGIDQPHLERILILTFVKRDEECGAIQMTKLIIEVMGRYSNIILAGDAQPEGVKPRREGAGQEIVLDSWKRVPAGRNRFRVILPRHPYVPPPPQAKAPPEALDAARLRQLVGGQRPETLVWQALVATIAGMSPLLAREAVFRAFGDTLTTCAAAANLTPDPFPSRDVGTSEADATPGPFQSREGGSREANPIPGTFRSRERGSSAAAGNSAGLFEAIRTLFAPYLDFDRGAAGQEPSAEGMGSPARMLDGAWSPSIVRDEGRVVAFAPYLLTHLKGLERCASISEAAAAYYADLEEVSPVGIRKEQLEVRLAGLRDRHERRKGALERSLKQSQEAEQLRSSGVAILAAIGRIGPQQALLDADGRSIRLDPSLSAVENAQAYFHEYKKAKAGLAQVPELLAVEEAALAYLEEVAAQLDLAETVEDVRRVAGDLEAAGIAGASASPAPTAQPKSKAKSGKVGRAKAASHRRDLPKPYCVLPGGYEVYVGRSARENETVTFSVAGPEDLWLHARGVPGAHVVLKSGGRNAPESAVAAAGRLAAVFSRAKDAKRVAVDCTQRKHVHRVRAGLPGLVSYREEWTIDVRLG